MLDGETRAAFRAHIERLVEQGSQGNEDAIRSLACMALIIEGWRPEPPEPGETIDNSAVIDLTAYRFKLAA